MDKQEPQGDDKIMQKLQTKLSNYQASPPADAWQHINQKLSGTQLSEPFYKTIIGKASLALLVLTGLLWWFNNSSEPLQLSPSTKSVDSTKLNTAPSEAIKVERINVQQKVSTTVVAPDQAKHETQTQSPIIADKMTDAEQKLLETTENIQHADLAQKDSAQLIAPKHQAIKKKNSFYESVRQDTNIKKQNLFVPK